MQRHLHEQYLFENYSIKKKKFRNFWLDFKRFDKMGIFRTDAPYTGNLHGFWKK